MSEASGGNFPPVGFYYAVFVLGHNNQPSSQADASFHEVSGISVSLETEQIKEGGQNRFVHRVPGRASYSDLVLKRGLMVRSSALADWCNKTFKDNLTRKIEPKTIKVSLLDANDSSRKPLMSWVFTNAYPTKWDISSLDAQQSELAVESITFAYSYFEQDPAPGATGALEL